GSGPPPPDRRSARGGPPGSPAGAGRWRAPMVAEGGRPVTGIPRRPAPAPSRVDPTLVQVELALERAEHVVVDRPLGPQPEEGLALRVDHGALYLPVLVAGAGLLALPLHVLRAVGVGVAHPVEERPVARPHRVELVDPARGRVDHLLARVGLLRAQLGIGAEPERSDQP